MTVRRSRSPKALIIYHGKSEEIFASNLKSNLRLPLCIYKAKKGKSIQITSLMQILNGRDFQKIRFKEETCKYVKLTKTGLKEFKVFIIMDTDDCTHKQRKAFENKTMFKDHWLKPYIHPVINTPNLDEVLMNLGYPIDPKRKVNSYQKAFPGNNGDLQAFQNLIKKFEGCDRQKSNMIDLLYYLKKYIE